MVRSTKTVFLRCFCLGLLLGAAVLLLALIPVYAQPLGIFKPRIDPAGIEGALILAGKDVPAQAVQWFVALAGGKAVPGEPPLGIKVGGMSKARITVLYTASAITPLPKVELMKHLRKELGDDYANCVRAFGVIKPELLNDAEIKKELESSTGVWLHGDSAAPFGQPTPAKPLGDMLAKILKKGGVVAGSGEAAGLLAERRPIPSAVKGLYTGFGLLPDSLVGFPVAAGDGGAPVSKLLLEYKARVGYEIEHDAALLIQGRKIEALGDGKVTIHLAPCSFKPAKQIALQGKKGLADLTALRNAALARIQPEFPPKKLESPEVKKGTLVIVGGGGMPKGLVQKFVDLAGGDKAVIVVLPTAQPDPLPAKDALAEAFKKAGAKKVVYLKARKLKDVDSKETLDIFREATGIWFGGGRQWGFVDAYARTQAEGLMHEVLAKGGVIGGTSAGASIQGEYMPRGDPLGNLNIIAEGYEKGLGFLKGVGIDQHFTQRKRHADMTLLMKTYPQLLGIGIDETTALVVKGHVAEVTGNGKAFFYDTKRAVTAGEPDYEAVASGGSYDLKTRKVLHKGQAHAKSPQ